MDQKQWSKLLNENKLNERTWHQFKTEDDGKKMMVKFIDTAIKDLQYMKKSITKKQPDIIHASDGFSSALTKMEDIRDVAASMTLGEGNKEWGKIADKME